MTLMQCGLGRAFGVKLQTKCVEFAYAELKLIIRCEAERLARKWLIVKIPRLYRDHFLKKKQIYIVMYYL